MTLMPLAVARYCARVKNGVLAAEPRDCAQPAEGGCCCDQCGRNFLSASGFGSFDSFIKWAICGRQAEAECAGASIKEIPASTPESDAHEQGVETAWIQIRRKHHLLCTYAATGMVNDHTTDCSDIKSY